MCDDLAATVPQDCFALCSRGVFRADKLICHSNVINPAVYVSFDKGLFSISLLSFHSGKISRSLNALIYIQKGIQWQSCVRTKALCATFVDSDDFRSLKLF